MRKMSGKTLVLGVVLGCSGVLQTSESVVAGGGEPVTQSAWSGRVFALDESQVADGDSRYAISSVALAFEHRHWSLGLERQYFAWDRGASFPEIADGRDPWEFLNQIQLGYAHQHVHSERWMTELLAGGSLGFEDELQDSFSGYLGGYGAYQVNPELMLLIGFVYSQHQKVETDFDYMPILGVLWNPEALAGFAVQVGFPKTQASWQLDARNRLLVELCTLEGGVTRLADDSPVRERGYVALTSAALSLRWETCFGEDLDLSLGIGHSLHRELSLYDSDGKNERSFDVARGPSLELAIRKPF